MKNLRFRMASTSGSRLGASQHQERAQGKFSQRNAA